MIEFLVTILMVVVVIYVVHLVIGMLNLPAQVKNIAYLIVGLMALLWLLDFFHLYSFPR